MKTAREMTASEMVAAKSSDAGDSLRKVGRTLYRWSAVAEMWIALSA